MGHLKFKLVGLSAVFCCCLVFPMLNDTLGLVKDIDNFENRQAAKRPDFDINKLDPFPNAFDTFYNDRFNLRARIIQAFNLYTLEYLKKSPIPEKVILGENKWLYSAGPEMDSYQGKNRLTEKELLDFKTELEYRKAYLEKLGCEFYFLIAPAKANIHGEHIPYQYSRINKQCWGEQLIAYLTKNSTVKPISIFENLRSKKTEEDVYYHLDNHWNSLGGFYAANAVLNSVHKKFPSCKAIPRNDYKIKRSGECGGNLQKMLGNLPIFSEQCFELENLVTLKAKQGKAGGHPPLAGFPYPWEYERDKEIADSTAPKLLVISDSFGENIFPYLTENFSRSVKIFDAWQYKLNEDIVLKEKPDVYLLVIHEPLLRNFLEHPSRKN